MMCLETFNEKTIADFNSWGEWVLFVNQNYKISQTKSTIKDWIGKCKDTDLPYFHPYWGLMEKLNLRKTLLRVVSQYNECLKDSEKIKYYFNKGTSLGAIETKIKKLKEEVYLN